MTTMAIYNEQKRQQAEALKESLYAAKYCLNFEKESSKDWEGESGRLGYPSLVLLACIIDTIGSFFRGSDTEIKIDGESKIIETASDHFYVLNHSELFNLNLKNKTILDLYSTYRSKIVHNHSLPPNNFLKYDESDTRIFIINNDDDIVCINLYSLLDAVDKALVKFLHWLNFSTFSPDHKLSSELKKTTKSHSYTVAFGKVVKIEDTEIVDTSFSSGVNDIYPSGYSHTHDDLYKNM